MDISFESYGDYPLVGGHMLGELSMLPDDAGDVTPTVGFDPTTVNKSAPGELDLENLINVETDFSGAPGKWAPQDVEYLSLFENLPIVSEDDIAYFLSDEPANAENALTAQPLPVFPAMSDSSEMSEFSSKVLDDHSPSSPDSGIGGCTALGSPDSSMVGSPDSSFLVESPASQETTSASPQGDVVLQAASDSDLDLLGSLWAAAPLSTSAGIGSDLLIARAGVVQADVTPPKKPPRIAPKKMKGGSRAIKALTSEEKRERKRAQNKDAATRYREKKRAEGQSVYTEQTRLEEKNRTLKDKHNQVTREIQYLKELLIEVYRTKGLIE